MSKLTPKFLQSILKITRRENDSNLHYGSPARQILTHMPAIPAVRETIIAAQIRKSTRIFQHLKKN